MENQFLDVRAEKCWKVKRSEKKRSGMLWLERKLEAQGG
jgi:hypothetical protein